MRGMVAAAGIACAVLALAASGGRGAERIDVPTDPRATYTVVSLGTQGAHASVVTRRDGPSGASHAWRLVDCAGMRFTYAGQGDTLQEAMRPRRDGWGPLVRGSISYYVAAHACARLRR